MYVSFGVGIQTRRVDKKTQFLVFNGFPGVQGINLYPFITAKMTLYYFQVIFR